MSNILFYTTAITIVSLFTVQLASSSDPTIVNSHFQRVDDLSAIQKNQVKYDEIATDIIIGDYVSRPLDGSEDSCEIAVHISHIKTIYYYRLLVAGSTYKGILKISNGYHTGEKSIIFTGIKWALNEGDVSNLKDNGEPAKLKLPVGINGIFRNNEIIIQNSGNAMNHYVQIEACEQKYIRLVKQIKTGAKNL